MKAKPHKEDGILNKTEQEEKLKRGRGEKNEKSKAGPTERRAKSLARKQR